MAALKLEQDRVKTLLCDTVTMLCKNGLSFSKTLRVQGLLGVTIDDQEVLLVQISEYFDNFDCGAVNYVDSTNEQAIKITSSHVSMKQSPSTVFSRIKNHSANNSRVKQKHLTARVSRRDDVETTAVKPAAQNIKLELQDSRTIACEEDDTIIISEDNTENCFLRSVQDYNDSASCYVNDSNYGKNPQPVSRLADRGTRSGQFVPFKREIPEDVGIIEMDYDDKAQQSGDEVLNNGEEWPEGGRSTLNDSSYVEYGSWGDQSGEYNEDGYQGAGSQVAVKGQQAVFQQSSNKHTASKGSICQPRVRKSTGHINTQGSAERGEVNEYCATKSLHECTYPGCGKQFHHKQHLLRHQTQKHNRAPKRFLAYSKYWIPADEIQLPKRKMQHLEETGEYDQGGTWGSSGDGTEGTTE